jgi:hypothetical protein
MKFDLSNVLALVGVLSTVIGVCMLSIAAGFITLGLFLIVGAVATARPNAKPDAMKKAQTS